MNCSPSVSTLPNRSEWLGICALLVTSFLLNVFTYYVYPAVWVDEILFSEPAINLIRNGHFTTWVWQLEPANTFWAVNSPLYPFLLSVWLRLAGFSLLAVRSFNYFLITIAAFMVWVISWKFQLIRERLVRLVAVGLVLLGYGISFAYRSSRPDISGLVCVLGLALAFAVENRQRRAVLVFLCAAITAWIGVQVSLYACCAVFFAKIAFRRVSWREVILTGVGAGFGFCLVLAFYHLKGVLPVFMALLREARTEHIVRAHQMSYLASVPRRVGFSLLSYVEDFSAVPLLAGIVIAFFFGRQLFSNCRAIVYLMALFFGIPLLFNFTGHFAFYYSELTYLPLVLAFSMIYSNANAASGLKMLKRAVLPLSALAAGIGLPLRLLLCATFVQFTPRHFQREIIQVHIRPEDVVFSDYNSFFEAKQFAQRVFIPEYSTNFATLSPEGHDFSPEEKQGITVLLVDPDRITNLKQYFGGRWKAVSDPFGDEISLGRIATRPIIGPRLQHHFETPQMNRHKLQIFRRENAE